MKNLVNWLFNPPTDGPRATLLLRLMAGSVFLWEGIMKFVFPNQGIGRFTKLGFPAPHFVATTTLDPWTRAQRNPAQLHRKLRTSCR